MTRFRIPFGEHPLHDFGASRQAERLSMWLFATAFSLFVWLIAVEVAFR